MLDLFIPIKMVMEAVQGYAVAAWKCVVYMDALISHFSRMSIPRRIATPMLEQHFGDLLESRFKGKFSLQPFHYITW